MKQSMSNVYQGNSLIFTLQFLLSTWLSKLLPLLPLSLVAVRWDCLRSPCWGQSGAGEGWDLSQAVPLGCHILLLVPSTQSTHSPSQECFSPDLMLSKSYQCYNSCIYAVKGTNLIDLWPQRRKSGVFLIHQNICGAYRWCTGLCFLSLIWTEILVDFSQQHWISA